MRYQFIAAEKADFKIAELCRAMRVAESGYYAFLKRGESQRRKDDEKLKLHIRASHKASGKTYGSPRIHRDLRADGFKVGKNRVARLMRHENLRGDPPKRFRRTTDSKHDKPVAPNLLDRNFENATAPNQVWAADITYVWTAMGWLYLAIVIDIFSRRIVGFAIDDHMRTELVSEALESALISRDVSEGLMHHSDRGSQYASEDYREQLEKAGVILSMSRKGDCWDNAVAESFFATLKKDLIHRQYWFTKNQTIAAVSNYITNFYNRRRRHSSIGYMSPADYERLTMLKQVA